MRNLFLLLTLIFLYSCDNKSSVNNTEVNETENINYKKNLKTAQRFLQLHEVEDLESQIAMLSDDLIHEPPRYGSEFQDKDGFINDVKGYQDAFEEIK